MAFRKRFPIVTRGAIPDLQHPLMPVKIGRQISGQMGAIQVQEQIHRALALRAFQRLGRGAGRMVVGDGFPSGFAMGGELGE